MTARAVLADERIDRGFEQRRIAREALARPRIPERRRLEHHATATRGDVARAVRDPGSEDVGTGVVAREPAVVTARDLADHLRVLRRGQGDDGVGGLIGEVDVVLADELRRLATRDVTLPAA